MGQQQELTIEEKAALWDFVESTSLPQMIACKNTRKYKGVARTKVWVQWETPIYDSETEYHNFDSEDDSVYKLLKKAGY